MVVCDDDVSESREALLDSLDADRVWQRVAQVLELLVGCGRGHEKALSVARSEAANDASARNGGADGGNDVLEFGLEDTECVSTS